MMNSKVLIIIPTYNESQSIEKTIQSIIDVNKSYDILVIDDNSPDKTSEIVNNLNNESIFLIKRDSKLGLGSAYCEGYKYAITNKYDLVVQIDADLSHNPKDIPALINESKSNDLVIGSRYIEGIRIINWPISRLFLSYFANLYSRVITGMPVFDSTGGFKVIKTNLLSNLDLNNIKSEGYSFQIEINFLAWMKKYNIKEIPIIFTDRILGDSKMSYKIIFEAIYMVPLLRLKRFFNIIK